MTKLSVIEQRNQAEIRALREEKELVVGGLVEEVGRLVAVVEGKGRVNKMLLEMVEGLGVKEVVRGNWIESDSDDNNS